MSAPGCRINVVVALGNGRADQVSLRDLMRITAVERHELVPEPLRCFTRVVEHFAPEDLDEYKRLVLTVAESVAEAAKGVSDKESDALDKIRAALG